SPSLLSTQETVDRLLRLHFQDSRTRVHGDAQLLMAEMLKIFVRGKRTAPAPAAEPRVRPSRGPSDTPFLTAEAAARAARQAQAEDLVKVDIEHLEKILPQLVGDC
ncbi:CENPX protein, partial [Bucco capensis]|nr:CENPX protein [Bucco capensis]